jgi:hypothetical protein
MITSTAGEGNEGRRHEMGDKGKKDRDKGRKQKLKKQEQEARRKRDKQPKRTP